MIISFKNFGPLLDFSADLTADFTLIVGDNNIGKSYAISLIYALLKNATTPDNQRGFFNSYAAKKMHDSIPSNLKTDFLRSFKEKKDEKYIEVTELVQQATVEYFKAFYITELENSIASTFGDISNLSNRKNNDPAEISIKQQNASITLRIVDDHLCVHEYVNANKFIYRKSKQRLSPRPSKKGVIIYGSETQSESGLQDVVMTGMINFVSFTQNFFQNISEAHYLPASRSGLYQALSAFSQIIAELSRRRSFLSQKIELPAIPEPLSDYFIKLTDIKQNTVDAPDNKFLSIAAELERDILEGSIEYDAKSRRLMYLPFDVKNLKLDLSSTSSMVSEVAPIVAYMRHVLAERDRRSKRINRGARRSSSQQKQIIFIEEPEAHLHPRNQALLMEAFAKIVSECDAKIVMTSHSNYVFNKISNLVIGGKFGDAKITGYFFKKTNLGTIGESLEIDRYGITDENFTETAEKIFEEKMTLIDDLENKNANQ